MHVSLLASTFELAALVPRAYSVDEVLAPYIYTFYAAFIVSFLFTPLMRRVAVYYGAIDQPDRVRKIHSAPVAYLGGIAVFLGWLAGLATSQFVHLHRYEPELPAHIVINPGIVIGSLVIIALGLWDDLRKINPWVKIGGQILAAVLLLSFGMGSQTLHDLLLPIDLRLHEWFHVGIPPAFLLIASAIATIAIVVGCCNATNLMDGLDGLCGGVTAIISLGFLFVATNLAMTGGATHPDIDGLRVVLALVLLGAVLGFTPYNFNPASIFMGDTGSMFLGFSCATLIVLMAQNQHPKWFLASMVIFALPVLDTTLAFTRRLVNKRPVFSADKHHFHHQLVARGFTVKQTVLISYGLTLFFAIMGIAIVYMRTRFAIAFYLVIFGSLIVAAYKMGMIHEKARVITPMSLGDSVMTSKPIDPGAVVEIRDDLANDDPAALRGLSEGWQDPTRRSEPVRAPGPAVS